MNTRSPLSQVRAPMKYSVDNGRSIDYYFYEPEPGVELNPPATDIHEVVVHNAWPQLDRFTLDREGFELHAFPDVFEGFRDEARVRAEFYPLVVDHVKRHSGARRVVVFDHTIRMGLPANEGKQVVAQRPAVLMVHSDYTPESGPQRVREIVPDDAEDLLEHRVVFYNVWKPLRRVEELPLAMCDATSQNEGDMLVMKLKYRDRTGEIYAVRYAPSHRWYYFPYMEASHALMFKTYDSETDGRSRFVGHSAFEDPQTPVDALKRESVEVRTMAFF